MVLVVIGRDTVCPVAIEVPGGRQVVGGGEEFDVISPANQRMNAGIDLAVRSFGELDEIFGSGVEVRETGGEGLNLRLAFDECLSGGD